MSAAAETPSGSAKDDALVLVQRYLRQLVKGCGEEACANPHCSSNPQHPKMERSAAVREAVRLAKMNPRPELCAAILAIPANQFKSMAPAKRAKQAASASSPSSSSPSSPVASSSSTSSTSSQPQSPPQQQQQQQPASASPAPPRRHPSALSAAEFQKLAQEGAATNDYRLAIRAVGQLFSSFEALAESFFPPPPPAPMDSSSSSPSSSSSSSSSSSAASSSVAPPPPPEEEHKVEAEAGSSSEDVQMSADSEPSAASAVTHITTEATATDCHVDLAGFDEACRSIVNTPALCNALHNALAALSPARQIHRFPQEPSPQHVRPWALLVLATPVWSNPDFYDQLKQLLECVKRLPRAGTDRLVEWLSRLGVAGIEPVLAYVQQMVTVRLLEGSRSIPAEVWLAGDFVQRVLFAANVQLEARQLTREQRPILDVLPVSAFYNPIINEEYDMETDFAYYLRGQEAFCRYPAILDAANKAALLREEATDLMRQHYHQTMRRHLMGGLGMFMPPPNPRLVLLVERAHLIQTTLFRLQDIPPEDFKKPLQIKFEGEEGVDQGGPQKEFFQLLIQQLFDPKYGMFVYSEENRLFWINQDSMADMDGEFRLIGILFGLAIFNGVILDVHFPQVMFKKLLEQPTGLADLQQSHPTLHRTLTKLLEAQEDVSTWGLSFTATYETVFGDSKDVDLVPGGSDIEVTNDNRQEYIRLYVDWLLNKSIARQFNAFLRGFHEVCTGDLLRTLRPPELELLVCGSSELQFADLREGVRWVDGYTGKEEICEWLWEILFAMDEKDQRRFLAFTTGSDRTPINGLRSLGLVIGRHGGDSETLPSSHTCFNHLLLPQYSSKEKLQQKLAIAIANSQGFGLL